MRAAKAGLIYFKLLFAVGWILGPIRELWGGAAFWSRDGSALRSLMAMIVSSRWVMRWFDVPLTLGSTIPMGLVALGILARAEIAGVLPESALPAAQPLRQ
jgi:hypothetical protein